MAGDPVKTSLSSVIVCTHNRSHSLKRTLHSLANQTLGAEAFEVVVVDDGSDDATLEVCDTMQGRMSNLTAVSTGKNMGLGTARNVGLGHVRGGSVLFTDDDCIPDKTWVGCMASALRDHPIVAGAIESPRDNLARLCHNIAEFHPFMPGRKSGDRDHIAGANVGFRRWVLEEIGGFEEGRRMAEDMELIIRARMAGHRAFFAPRAKVIHNADRMRFKEIFQYSSRHAKTTIVLRNRYQDFLRTPTILKSSALLMLFAPLMSLKVVMEIYLRNRTLLPLLWTAPVIYGLKLAWCWGASQGLREMKKGQTSEMV